MGMDREQQLIEARLQEAQALFSASNASKERTDRILGLGVVATAAAATAGVANDFAEVLLAVPTALSMLMGYIFMLYADVIALGMARLRIEDVLRDQLRADVLIAELVAPARHGGWNNPSIPLTQAVYVLFIGGSAVAGGIIANTIGLWPLLAYLIVTVLAMATLVASWIDMERTWARARELVAPYGAT
jgi:hypothetical protein